VNQLNGSDVAVVRGAKVPVIRFEIILSETKTSSSSPNNVIILPMEVDLIFVAVHSSTPPTSEDLLNVEKCFGVVTTTTTSTTIISSSQNNNNNNNINATRFYIAPEHRMSINGVRTALEITQRLNPSTTPNAFRTLASAVKNWAIVRGVFGNNFAFPGGVAFAVLALRILQSYPKDCVSGLFIKFFQFYDLWLNGPTINNHTTTTTTSNNNNNRRKPKVIKVTASLNPYPEMKKILGMPESWSAPINNSNTNNDTTAATNSNNNNIIIDTGDVFPVLNPAFPYLNTTWTMTQSTVNAFGREVSRAKRLIKKHLIVLSIELSGEVCLRLLLEFGKSTQHC
jgi:hypothetical protein